MHKIIIPVIIFTMVAYLECADVDLLFNMVRNMRGVDMDWVKSQVYGLKTVPETFPSGLPSFRSIINRLIPETKEEPEEGECEHQDRSSEW